MVKQTRRNSVVDLTPLLDVVLILLFALLMTMSMEHETYKEKAENLEEELTTVTEEKENLLISQETLQSNLDTLMKQQASINEAILTWFTNEEIRGKEIVTSSDLANVFDKDKTQQSLYQMDFIANQFFFIEVSFDTDSNHEVFVNEATTNVQLDFDKRNNQDVLKSASEEIYDAIERIMDTKNGGYKFVLLTLRDNGATYKFAFDLVWNVLKDIEKKHGSEAIYKLQYLNY